MKPHFPMGKRIFSLLAVLAVLLLGSSFHLGAQTTGAGTITGTVTDPQGAAVPNVPVTITNTDTGVTRVYNTNTSGIYVAPFVQSGHYKISATTSGFSPVEATGLTLQVGQTLTIDLALSVQSTSATVEVTSAAPLIDVDKTEVSQVVSQQVIQNLPVNGRNWSDFVLLTPNVVPDGGSGLVSFHGISGLYNQNYVDGANNNQMLFSEARGRASGAPFIYSLDSIKEFQANAATYSAEFGQAAGGQVNAITKNGTNHYHGDLFYYLRYPTLNALDPVTKYNALNGTPSPATPFLLTQPTHQQQEFGGSVGGPFIKDKLFFFLTSDNFRRVGSALYYETNPVSLTDTPDNSAHSVISPTQCPTTIAHEQCVAGIQFLLDLQGAPSRFAKETLVFPRIDYQINQKNLVYANFNFANFDQSYGYNASNTFSNTSPSTNAPTSYHERFVIAHWTSTLTNSAVNDFRFQWGRDLETAGANAPGPSVSMGAETYGMPNALPRIAEPDEHRFQITDVFDKVIGRHTWKFGGDANIVHEVMINLFQGGGIYGYSGTVTREFQNWIADAFAGQAGDTDPYAGAHYNTFVQTVDLQNPTTSGRAGADDFWMKMFDGFAEDTWKISRNVTLNLGVRYDIQLTPDPALPNKTSALASEYNTTIKNVANRIQPRIGFSWNPYPKTVVRGGYGIFTGLNQGSTYYAMRVENGIYQINYNYSGCNAACTDATAPALRFPNVPFLPPGPSLDGSLHPDGGTAPTVSAVSVPGTSSFHGLSPDFVPPLTHEAALSVEQELPGHFSLSIGYVGSRALRLPVFFDANLVGQKPTGTRSFLINNPDGSQKLWTVPYYRTADRIDPTLTSINAGFSVANSWYHSMAITLRKPFSHGVEVLLNHTWAKASDMDQVGGQFGTFYGGDTPLDPNNLKFEAGRSDLDVRNRFVGTIVWKPEIYQSNPFVRHILDDFTFSGTATESDGVPIFLGMSGTVASSWSLKDSGGNVVASSPAGQNAADGNIFGGAMSSSSGAPTTGRPPQVGRNSITGPGVHNIDFRITRNIPIHESIYLQFIGEAFNLLNQQIISGVNSTYSVYSGPALSGSCSYNTATPAGSTFWGCITPYTGTGSQAFGAATGSNTLLYGPRQLQVSAKLFF